LQAFLGFLGSATKGVHGIDMEALAKIGEFVWETHFVRQDLQD